MSIKYKKHREYRSPIVTFCQPPETEAARHELCRGTEQEYKTAWEQTRNPLYVLEAFFRRYADMTVEKESAPEATIPFPVWMAKPIAEWFEVYYSNLILEGNMRTSLDACAKINKKHKKEFNDFTITADQIIDQAYYFMWLFKMGRTLAIELAYDFIEARVSIDSDGEEGMFNFSVSIDTVIQYADRGRKFENYNEWLEKEGHLKRWLNDNGTPMLDDNGNPISDTIYLPPGHIKKNFLEYIGCISEEVKSRIEAFIDNKG